MFGGVTFFGLPDQLVYLLAMTWPALILLVCLCLLGNQTIWTKLILIGVYLALLGLWLMSLAGTGVLLFGMLLWCLVVGCWTFRKS